MPRFIGRALCTGVATVAAVAVACSENLESSEFNAYFYYPDDREVHLGVVRGISECQSAASAYAASKGFTRSDRWDYICCRRTSSSECATKHR